MKSFANDARTFPNHARALGELLGRIIRGSRSLEILRSASLEAFQEAQAANAAHIATRRAIEQSSIPHGNQPFTLEGYCCVCASKRSFLVSQANAYSELSDGRIVPNWREHLNCSTCGMGNRIRAAFELLKNFLDVSRGSRVYITEQVTPAFSIFKQLFPLLIGSEYLSPELRSGEYRNGIRHEDAQALSFDDGSLDCILSFDVMEHVPDPSKAFEEFHRCLAPGGLLLFTAPFDHGSYEELLRARLNDDGTIEHLCEPEYHGNPVDPDGGALCFRNFGWSVLDTLRGKDFVDAEVLSVWSRPQLNFGDGLHYICARKPA